MKTAAAPGRAISIPTGILYGQLTAPPSKSVAHRLLILAALARRNVRIIGAVHSADTRATVAGLRSLGYRIQENNQMVEFTGYSTPETPVHLHVGESGTTARFLTALAAIHPPPIFVDGSERMRQRPMAELIQALTRLGTHIEHNQGHLPLTIFKNIRRGGEIPLKVHRSSQYLSALMLIAPRLKGGLTIRLETPLVSASYVELTIHLLRQAGIPAEHTGNMYHVPEVSTIPLPAQLTVEGDFSGAAYFLAGAALTGGEVQIRGLSPASVQGDRQIVEVLAQSGFSVRWRGNTISISGQKDYPGFTYDCQHCPDLVPTLAVLALFASSPTRLRNISHLRFKESDRVQAVVENIQRLNGEARVDGQDLLIFPKPLKGTTLPTYNDHRIAMSFALAGLRVPGVNIENPDVVSKSYPEFWETLFAVLKPDSIKKQN